jgi:hypothetical protein
VRVWKLGRHRLDDSAGAWFVVDPAVVTVGSADYEVVEVREVEHALGRDPVDEAQDGAQSTDQTLLLAADELASLALAFAKGGVPAYAKDAAMAARMCLEARRAWADE